MNLQVLIVDDGILPTPSVAVYCNDPHLSLSTWRNDAGLTGCLQLRLKVLC